MARRDELSNSDQEGGRGRDFDRRRRRTLSDSWQKVETPTGRPKPQRRRSATERVHEVNVPGQLKSPETVSSSSDTQLLNVPYPYTALNLANPEREFRLLILNPGSGESTITSTLIHSNLHHPRRYRALSYTWGDSLYHPAVSRRQPLLPRTYIYVDGHRVSVGTNLHSALWHLRQPQRSRIFWIDDICINQNSVDEKGNQVELMREIYQKARGVIAWLGRSHGHSEVIMGLAEDVVSESLASRRQLSLYRAMSSKDYNFLEVYRDFFRRSYWYRTWVIQEIFSAALTRIKIQCGNEAISWDTLVAFQQFITIEFFGKTYVDIVSGPVNLWKSRRVITRPQMEYTINSANRFIDLSRLRGARDDSDPSGLHRTLKPLEDLLLQHWNAVATDPRDKIFAIFRLASDSNEYDITVDYGHGVIVEELYMDVVKQCIELSGKLSIILPRRPRNTNHHLPSWCPDWSSTTPASRLGNWADIYPFQVEEGATKYFAAGDHTHANVKYLGHSLIAPGFPLDDVLSDSRHDRRPIAIKEKQSLFSFSELLLSLFYCGPRLRSHDARRKATELEVWYAVLRRALRLNFSNGVENNNIPQGKRSFKRYCQKQHENFFWALHRATNQSAHERPRQNRTEETKRFFNKWRHHGDIPERYSELPGEAMTPQLLKICYGMGEIKINENYTNFFVTREGFMGLGPTEMTRYDRICILQGCAFPVVLRWERPSYRLLGPCYVVGAMHGDCFRGNRRLVEHDFEIH